MTVEELLVQQSMEYKPQGRDLLVKCINPEHDDSNPSMRIDGITGIFQCFACATKGNIFTVFGERANQLQIRRELLKRKLYEKQAESIGLALPESLSWYEGSWRDIKPETYKKFQAFESSDPDYIGRIVFPVIDLTGKIRAFIGRHTTQGTPKYKVTPPKAKMPFYPKAEPYQGHILLVEGIFDVLNLHDKGLTNAVCSFGTKTINEDKLRMLSIQGVDTVDIFLDGDEAGQSAAALVANLCDSADVLHRNINLKGTDPGALSQAQVDGLKKKLYK